MKIRTHYDNLKVSRYASKEDIKRAYRRLCFIHHPDKHPKELKKRQTEILKIINEAYKVLSNDNLRNAHDLWIIKQEQEQEQEHNRSQGSEQAHNYGWEQSKDNCIYNDFNFERVKEKTISIAKTAMVIFGSIIILLVGTAIKEVIKNNNSLGPKSEFENAFNREIKKTTLPVKVDKITTLTAVYAHGFEIHYQYSINVPSTSIDMEKIKFLSYGSFKMQKICEPEISAQLPVTVSFHYYFEPDHVAKEFRKTLPYLCGR
ncbi:TPA: J domain-containing protein [Klebsiella pneumoniae]|nr:J domain-containing protein [Klebsiella pneumoniae]MDZ1126446.1 J domain-containing protein [Klebsiella pneumoniae]MDZ1132178.1 J domain-containing protein [Klebsiella pneumoniae]HEE4105220.1 J domain-containing protein [Klebsiella pneumoniae]